MTGSEVEKAARRDPDPQPLTRDDLKRMRRTRQVKIIRRSLGLTQEEFAARYRILIGTLRDLGSSREEWIDGRTELDQPARAYLTVIARDPRGGAKSVGECTTVEKVKTGLRCSLPVA